MPTNILNLPAYHVTRFTETEHDYHVYAQVAAPVGTCLHCHAPNKEEFFGLYEASTAEEALRAYHQWQYSIPPELRAAFQPILTAWGNWQPQILAYFERPVTNAYTESLNNLIRLMNRLGRGYSFDALRAKILFTEGLHKHKLSRPKYTKQPTERVRKAVEPVVAAESIVGYELPRFGVRERAGSAPTKQQPLKVYDPASDEKNYGVDIEALIAALERGEL